MKYDTLIMSGKENGLLIRDRGCMLLSNLVMLTSYVNGLYIFPSTFQAITSSGTKKGEFILADVNTQLKNKNMTTDVKIDTNSNVSHNTLLSCSVYLWKRKRPFMISAYLFKTVSVARFWIIWTGWLLFGTSYLFSSHHPYIVFWSSISVLCFSSRKLLSIFCYLKLV